MAFNVSGLSDYTKKATKFLVEGLLYNDSYSEYTIQSDIQFKNYLNFIDANPVVTAGGCGTDPSGTTIFSQKTIEVVKMSVKEQFCLSDLDKKDLGHEIGTSKGKMSPDLKTVMTQDIIRKVKDSNDKLLWTGKVSTGSLIDGWITEALADSDVIDVTSSSAATITTIDDIVTEMILAATPAMLSRGMLTIHMSLTDYNLYKQNRINANMYHDDPKNKGLLTMDVFGWESMVRIKAETGLAGHREMLMTWDKNLIVGTDQFYEVAKAEYYFEPISKNVYFLSDWKLGNTYAYGTEIVLFHVA
jgi:hypothetical protein